VTIYCRLNGPRQLSHKTELVFYIVWFYSS